MKDRSGSRRLEMTGKRIANDHLTLEQPTDPSRPRLCVHSGPRCPEEGQKVGRQHQLEARSRHQVGKVRSRLQVDPQGHALWKVEARPHLR